MKKIIIICNGGFGNEMRDYIDDAFPNSSEYRFGRIQDLFPDDELVVKPDEVFVVANGDPAIKAKLVRKIEAAGGSLLTVIHPTAYVAKSAVVGAGAILCPFAFVGPYAVLDPHVTINVHAGCGHHTKIGTFAVLSPYCSISGAAEIGEGTFLGTHCYVAQEKTIGAHSKLSAGTFATEDVPERSLAMGNPARIIAGYFGK